MKKYTIVLLKEGHFHTTSMGRTISEYWEIHLKKHKVMLISKYFFKKFIKEFR